MTALTMTAIEGDGHTPSASQIPDSSLEFVPGHWAVSHICVRYTRLCSWIAARRGAMRCDEARR